MSDIRDLLEDRIEKEFENLNDLQTGSREKTEAVDALERLYKLMLEEDKLQFERQDKDDQVITDDREREVKVKEMEEEAKNNKWKLFLNGAEIVVPQIFYAFWMHKGFKFEETGTFTSNTFKWLIKFFKPTKK